MNASGRERRLLAAVSEAVRAWPAEPAVQQEGVRSEHRRGRHLVARALLHSVQHVLQRTAAGRTRRVGPAGTGDRHIVRTHRRRYAAGERSTGPS